MRGRQRADRPPLGADRRARERPGGLRPEDYAYARAKQVRSIAALGGTKEMVCRVAQTGLTISSWGKAVGRSREGSGRSRKGSGRQ